MRAVRTALVVLAVLATGTLAILALRPAVAETPGTPRPPISLRLETTKPEISSSDVNTTFLRARLINDSDVSISVAQPGDGSRSGWRSPVVKWIVTTASGQAVEQQLGRFCGNRNSMAPDEIVSIPPKGQLDLNAWTGRPVFPDPGVYHVALSYENVPDVELQGLSGDDPEAIRRLRSSTRCAAISNTVVVTVLE